MANVPVALTNISYHKDTVLHVQSTLFIILSTNAVNAKMVSLPTNLASVPRNVKPMNSSTLLVKDADVLSGWVELTVYVWFVLQVVKLHQMSNVQIVN